MHHSSVQAFPMGCKFTLFVGNPPPRGKIALTVLPSKAPLAVALDAAFVIVVPGVVGAALPIQLAFQATLRARLV